MTITVKYFGLLTDITLLSEEQFFLKTDSISLEQLKAEIENKYPSIAEINFIIAVNQMITGTEKKLKANDIIALLPPFAGG